ncbi:MAG: anion transporter [Planctomycetia bacterium]|nr:anion transporter [Planctomycetia bacterium]
MDARQWFCIIIFVITYIGMARGSFPGLILDRVAIAWLGAVALLTAGVIHFQQATQFINFETLGLLLGMMVIVAVLRRARFFVRVADWAASRVATQHGFLFLVIVLSSTFSAILVNDVICLALPPLVIRVCRDRGWSVKPHLIALALASNLGSACTPIGNPQNMLIAEWSHISFLTFLSRLSVPTLISLLGCFGIMCLMFQKSLSSTIPIERTLHDVIYLKPSRRHDRLMVKSILILVITVAGFLAGFHLATVALTAAAVLILDRFSPRFIWREIDWSLLLMFTGLFIVVGAMDAIIIQPGNWTQWPLLERDPVGLLSLLSATLSNLVSNVPAVLLFKPILLSLPVAQQETGWLALAMSSTFAGNLTILGSVANLIVVEYARRDGINISFWDYSKVGIPVTIGSILIGVFWLWMS